MFYRKVGLKDLVGKYLRWCLSLKGYPFCCKICRKKWSLSYIVACQNGLSQPRNPATKFQSFKLTVNNVYLKAVKMPDIKMT